MHDEENVVCVVRGLKVRSPSLCAGQVDQLEGGGLGHHAVLDAPVQRDRVHRVRATRTGVQKCGGLGSVKRLGVGE